jgi:hypothetical protein
MTKSDIQKEHVVASLSELFDDNKYITRAIVPFHGSKVDVLVMDRTTKDLTAIALGWRSWNSAIRLAAAYQLITKSVYIALWHKSVGEDRQRALTELGIGIIAIAPDSAGKTLKATQICSHKRLVAENGKYADELRREFA